MDGSTALSYNFRYLLAFLDFLRQHTQQRLFPVELENKEALEKIVVAQILWKSLSILQRMVFSLLLAANNVSY